MEISQKALERAERWHQGAKRAFEDKRWDDVIYSFQMSVEQAMKAVLILYGIEYPKVHDISPIYFNLSNADLPTWFMVKIDFHASTLERLTEKRGLSAYGYIDGVTKNSFYDDAERYREPVAEVLADCSQLIREFSEHQT
ncbi:MAG: HEPN domain-containing protein [Promethearchaeia archaeon]